MSGNLSAMAWVFLLLSIWGALCTLAARFPARRNKILFLPTFFISWLTIELAAHHLAIQVIVTALFIRAGVLHSWPGRVGLVLCLVSWTALVIMVLQGRASAKTMREAIADLVPGDDEGPKVPMRQVVLPFARGRRDVQVKRNILFQEVAGQRLKLDVYRPRRRPTTLLPAVLQIHGGAWVLGDKREQGIPLLTHLAANGWVGFNANYRLSPGATFPDHLVDLKRAVAWIREHGHRHGADPDYLIVTGGSAGGHLTALMALTANDPRYQPGFEDVDTSFRAAVPFYGVYDFTNRLDTSDPVFVEKFLEPLVMKAFLDEEPERFADASPIDLVREDAPPFLVIHGDRDTLAPVVDARLFVERLRGVSHEPVLYAELAGSQHAFDVFASIRTVHVIEGVERFLRAVRKGAMPDEGAAERHVEEQTDTDTDVQAAVDSVAD